MTLTESVTYDDRGYPMENSLFQYKIPARVDIGRSAWNSEDSYEGEGPFGAKSISEGCYQYRCKRFRMQSEMP